jgi:lipopolysaccharide assembly protein A
MYPMVISALALALLTVVFVMQNGLAISVRLFLWHFEGSLALILIITFVLGFVASSLLTLSGIFRRSRAIKAHKKRIEELEDKLSLTKPPEFFQK